MAETLEVPAKLVLTKDMVGKVPGGDRLLESSGVQMPEPSGPEDDVLVLTEGMIVEKTGDVSGETRGHGMDTIDPEIGLLWSLSQSTQPQTGNVSSDAFATLKGNQPVSLSWRQKFLCWFQIGRSLLTVSVVVIIAAILLAVGGMTLGPGLVRAVTSSSPAQQAQVLVGKPSSWAAMFQEQFQKEMQPLSGDVATLQGQVRTLQGQLQQEVGKNEALQTGHRLLKAQLDALQQKLGSLQIITQEDVATELERLRKERAQREGKPMS